MIGFIRNADPRLLVLLAILLIMLIFAPRDTAQLLGRMLVDILALIVELLTWFVELIKLSSSS